MKEGFFGICRLYPIGYTRRVLKTARFDVSGHLRSPEEMAAYLEVCFDEAESDAAVIAFGV